MKNVFFASLLLAVALSTHAQEPRSNLIQYEDIRPIQRIPYIYRGDVNEVLVETKPTVISDAYGPVIVPGPTEVSASILSTAVSCVIDVVKSSIYFILVNAPAMVVGAIVGLGVCKLTPLCDTGVSILEVQRELTSYATPDRLRRAAKLVREAIEKYNDIQK